MDIERRREQKRRASKKFWANRSPEKLDELRTYSREWARRKYASDEEHRKKQIEKRKAYAAANKEKIQEARQKRYSPAKSREVSLRKKYGLTQDEYARLLSAQSGGCAICGSPYPSGRGKHLYVDHCHDTGAVRGILCNRCNIGLSRFKDDSNLLRLAAAYLDRSRRAKPS